MIYPNLEAEMKRYGVEQRDIAKFLGKPKETISRWVNGKSGGFEVRTAIRVKERFFPNESVDYLFATEPIAREEARQVS